jgi:sulfhydrogenase subunit gamma (sulfur reductase)
VTRSSPARHPLRPELVRIVAARDETRDVRTLTLSVLDPAGAPRVRWAPGQFAAVSVFGAGEAVFTLANAPGQDGRIECTFRAVGRVTGALRELAVGDVVGFRGPYGNRFPVERWRGHRIVFVGGGIGMAALRAPIQHVLAHRADFGEIVILNGARTPADLVYRDECVRWQTAPGVRVVRAVDPGGETPDWDGEVGLLPDVFARQGLSPERCVVAVCGPPVMLRAMFRVLAELGFGPEQVVTTLENKMKCGVGQCGRCNIGRLFVCRDGPVFTWAQVKRLPPEF